MDPVSSALAQGSTTTIARLVERVGDAIIANTKGWTDTARTTFQMGFSHYLDQTKQRCSSVKTLIHRTEPVSIDSAYVPVHLKSEKRKISAKDLTSLGTDSRHVTISGTAGSGKSMTLKYTYVQLCSVNHGYIPIFIELRDVDFEQSDLVQYVSLLLEHFTGKLDRRALENGLSKGHFYVIMDGLDEVPRDQRRAAEKAILQFSSRFPGCRLLISSRPDSRLENWPSFVNYQVCPLDIDQVVDLITRIDYANDSKPAFCQRVRSSLYQSHKALLSNPLLATMMFMTFEEYAEVPSKMHIFYRQAFEVLYSKHDRFKPNFVRNYVTGLQFDSLERHIATFALMSLTDGRVAFDDENLNFYFERVAQYEGSGVKAADLAADLIDNLCLLVRDEGRVTFIHRSFQEYFAAHFLSLRQVDKFVEILDRLNNTSSRDRVISFLFEMNPEVLEKTYIIPKLNKMMADLKKNSRELKVRCSLLFNGLLLSESNNGEVTLAVSFVMTSSGYKSKWAAFYLIIQMLYPECSLHRCEALRKVIECLKVKKEKGQESVSLEVNEVSVTELRQAGVNELMREYQTRLEALAARLNNRKSVRGELISDLFLERKPS